MAKIFLAPTKIECYVCNAYIHAYTKGGGANIQNPINSKNSLESLF